MATMSTGFAETVTCRATARGQYRKGAPATDSRVEKFAEVELEVEPMPRDTGVAIVSALPTGAIPAQFMPDVLQGIYETLSEGVLAGYRVTDVRVIVRSASYDAASATPLSYRVAASVAIYNAVRSAHPVILAPMARVELETQLAMEPTVLRDVSRMHGEVLRRKPGGRPDSIWLEVRAPLHELVEAQAMPRASATDTPLPALGNVLRFDWSAPMTLTLDGFTTADVETAERLIREATADLARRRGA